MPIEKCVLPPGQPSGNNITHTERSWCQGQLSCKDVGDGRHVLIFHFVGVSEHVAAGRGCNEADRRHEVAPPARHPPAGEPPDTSRTINGRTRRTPSTWGSLLDLRLSRRQRSIWRRRRGNLADVPAEVSSEPALPLAERKRPMESGQWSCPGSCTAR